MGLIALLILVVPVVELIVIVEVATRIGFFETIGVLILISVAGAWLVRREGTAAWRRLQAALARGEIPTNEAIDGVLVVIGGALLLTPGFVTDLVGLLFLFPVTRLIARRWGRKVTRWIALRRFGPAATAAGAGTRIYDTRVTRARPVGDPAVIPQGRDASAAPKLAQSEDRPNGRSSALEEQARRRDGDGSPGS
ncbi:MAG: FxsA family protein [Actinomycetota bacterium]|nr:FxsA family protein [Actinomycetota bacterium]